MVLFLFLYGCLLFFVGFLRFSLLLFSVLRFQSCLIVCLLFLISFRVVCRCVTFLLFAVCLLIYVFVKLFGMFCMFLFCIVVCRF